MTKMRAKTVPPLIAAARLELEAKVAPLPISARNAVLLGLAETSIRNAPVRTFVTALLAANEILVKSQDLDAATGARMILRVRACLAALDGEGFESPRLWRDAEVAMGTFHARCGEAALAIRAFSQALDSERDPERRQLLLLALAEQELARGRLAEALAHGAELGQVALGSERELRMRLLRSGILLALGNVVAAEAVLRESRGASVSDVRLDLARRRIALFVRASARADAMPRRIADFVAWAHRHVSERVAAAAELEVACLRRVAHPDTIRRRDHFLSRAHFLARKAEATADYELVKALDAVCGGREAIARSFRTLEGMLDALGRSERCAFFQCVTAALMRRMEFWYRPKEARLCRELLARRQEELRIGVPADLVCRPELTSSAKKTAGGWGGEGKIGAWLFNFAR